MNNYRNQDHVQRKRKKEKERKKEREREREEERKQEGGTMGELEGRWGWDDVTFAWVVGWRPREPPHPPAGRN